MKRLIFVIVVIVAAVLAFGLYMGWFHVSSHSDDGKSNITLTVDNDRIHQDKDKAVAAVKDLGQQTDEDQTVDSLPNAHEQTVADVQPPPPGHE